jgi:hypothetical protein
MYDLEIRYNDRPVAPAEVTSDVDEKAAATLNTLYKMDEKGAWAAPSLERNWSLQTVMGLNLKKLKAHAEKSLRVLEQAGFTQFEAQVHRWRAGDQAVSDAANKLADCGVERAVSSPGRSETRIEVLPALGGGSWDGSAELVVEWINEFVASPRCADNLKKLTVAGATEGHLAVYAHMTQVSWPVWRALIDHYGTQVVPTTLPALPTPITHLWLFPSPGGTTGLAYDPLQSWYRFESAEPKGAPRSSAEPPR